MVRPDDDQVDRADIAACPDGRTKDEDPTADDLAPQLRDQHAGLGQIDELPQQIRGQHRPTITSQGPIFAEGDDAIDVGDAGRSDQVFHAAGSYLAQDGGP